jgi:hypothetical protein
MLNPKNEMKSKTFNKRVPFVEDYDPFAAAAKTTPASPPLTQSKSPASPEKSSLLAL